MEGSPLSFRDGRLCPSPWQAVEEPEVGEKMTLGGWASSAITAGLDPGRLCLPTAHVPQEHFLFRHTYKWIQYRQLVGLPGSASSFPRIHSWPLTSFPRPPSEARTGVL